MAYHVEWEDTVRGYIAAVEGLSEADRLAVVAGVEEELGRDADYFLATRPLSHESLHFRYDYPHAVAETRTVHTFDFIVSAEHREMGVVRVVFVDHTAHHVP